MIPYLRVPLLLLCLAIVAESGPVPRSLRERYHNYATSPPDNQTVQDKDDTKSADVCSLYDLVPATSPSPMTCAQSGIDCKYAKYAKLAEKGLKDGTCAAQGYTVKGTETTKKYPFVGDITITMYTKPTELTTTDVCSLWEFIPGMTCAQSDIACKYAKYAKLAEKGLKDGTCAAQGYPVKGESNTYPVKGYPFVGNVTITKYSKPTSVELNPNYRKYERIQKSQQGFQWNENGGYCGAWAIQRNALAHGAWISQQQARDHTSPAPGAPASHDNEILSSNIAEAFQKLKIKAEGWDYAGQPTPQQPAYFKWLKAQLVANNTVVWMIMFDGDQYPEYKMPLPSGVHSHIEPVVGIRSNHPLDTDDTVYDDDIFVHYTDDGLESVYKVKSTLSGAWSPPHGTAKCPPAPATTGYYGGLYCIGPIAYGWAVQGFLDDVHGDDALPLSLAVDPWQKEPNPIHHEAPIYLNGTVSAERLAAGSRYDIYRWDSVGEAFTYDARYKITSFTAAADTFVYKDPKAFMNNGTIYYRCVEEQKQ